ncbi:MAG: VCBS repeat-containing protein [Verrucomicrobiota bacterium]
MHSQPTSNLRHPFPMGWLLLAVLMASVTLHAAPSLAPIPDLGALEDAGVLEVPILLTPDPLPATAFQFSVTADNDVLLPPGSMTLEGTSPKPTLRIRTAPDKSGTATITVAALTSGDSPVVLLQSFRLEVTAVDDPPQIEPIPNQVLTLGAPPVRIPILVSDPDSEVVVQTAPTDDLQLVRINLEKTAAGRFLTLQPLGQRLDSPSRTQVRITATAGAKSATTQFFVTLRRREFIAGEELVLGQRWTSISPLPNGDQSIAMTWADINRDGYPDAVLPGRQVAVINPQYRGFSSSVAIGRSSDQGLRRTTWMDADGDGYPEVFAEGPAGFGIGTKSSAPNNPSIPLSVGSLVPLNVGGATWADVNGDGKPDLIYSGTTNTSRRVVIALRDDQGTYTPAPYDLPDVAGPVVAADFDRDGRVDLLLCDSSLAARAAQIYWNRLPIGWIAGPKVATDLPVSAAGFTDADGDGVLDVWLVQRSGNAPTDLELNVYLQQGSRFNRSFHLDSGEFFGAAAPAWGDFDHDGLPDFVAPRRAWMLQANGKETSTNYFVLYRNMGAGGFTSGEFLFAPPPIPTGRAPSFIPAAADIDLDGDLDVVGYQNSLRPFYNQRAEPNIPPEAPSGLQAFVLGEDLHLFWSAASDRNQTSPLTYNVRAGSRPGSGDIIPSQSLTNGLRQLPIPGNAGFLLSHTIHMPRLDSDAIYWSVQAVDASFSGGPFAPEQVLETSFPGNLPPSLQSPASMTLVEDAQGTINFTVTDDRTPPADLQLSVITDNPDLFPEGTLGIGIPENNNPTKSKRFLRLNPATNAFGQAMVFLIATDRNGASATNGISVVVTPVNDRPKIVALAPHYAYRGSTVRGTIQISDAETPAESLKLRVETSNPELLPLSGIAIEGTGTQRGVVLTPAADQIGEATVTLVVDDGNDATDQAVLQVLWQDQLLAPHPLYPGMTNLVRAHWVDFDGDGVADVVGADRSDNGSLVVWRQSAPGSFERTSKVNLGFEPYTLLIADFDGDGDADVVASSPPDVTTGVGATIVVIWNQGGQFVRSDILRSDKSPGVLAVFDMDADGDPDLVSADGTSELRVLRHSDRGFEGEWATLPLENPEALLDGVSDPGTITGLSVADYDGDGRSDLLLSRNRVSPQGKGLVLLQLPSGFFRIQQPAWNSSAQFVDSADFDNDGRADFLIQDWVESSANPARIVSSDFRQTALVTRLTSGGVGDLDGNGTEDALASFGILTGLATASGDLISQNDEFSNTSEPSVADYDHNGRLDLLAWSHAGLQLFDNLGVSSNRPPTVPTRLTFRQLPFGAVRLSWSPASDPDQSGGLTYNLRVGTAPGTNDIVPSLALPDGRALVAGRGNAGWSLEHEIRNLTPGRTYYWTVQAVDAGYARSAFAAEESFVVTGTPVISEIDDVSVPINSGTVEVPFTAEDPETLRDLLRIEVISLNAVLLPPSRIHLGGTPSQRVVVLEPRPDRAGTATIIIRVTDGDDHVSERSFTFYIPSNTGHAFETATTVDVPAGGKQILALNGFDPEGEFKDYQIVRRPDHGALETLGSTAIYRPDAKFLGDDTLEFLAFAPGSWPAFGRITLHVIPGHRIQPELRIVRVGFPQRLQTVVRSLAGTTVDVEVSPDLQHWTSLGEHSIPPSEILTLDPPNPAEGSTLFLRAIRKE